MILASGGRKPRWKACLTVDTEPKDDFTVPVRHLRVLYSLKVHDYVKWQANHTPTGHEFFCRHKSLGTYQAQPMQYFLRQMSIESHFRTRG